MKLIVDNIHIKVTKKNIKNINLRVVPPNGKVKVSAPKWLTENQIKKFIKSKMPWIKKNIKHVQSLDVIPRGNTKNGDIYYFLGKEYSLEIKYIERFPRKVKLENKNLIIFIKENTTKKQKEELIKEWYRKKLKEKIPLLIKKWENIIGVEVSTFGVKQMKTRWGTCNINNKKIWINLELIKLDPKYLEYIIVHEMVHLLERNHNKVFWTYMDKFLPRWKVFKKELDNLVIITK